MYSLYVCTYVCTVQQKEVRLDSERFREVVSVSEWYRVV